MTCVPSVTSPLSRTSGTGDRSFDLVLRRIRSLKRCVQVCGCKIMTPRYAVWRLCFCKASALKGNPGWLFWLASGWLGLASGWLSGWFGLFWLAFWLVWFGSSPGFLAGLVWLLAGFLAGLAWLLAGFLAGLVWLLAGFLAGLAWLSFFPVFLARLAETQLLGILQAHLGVIILQPHACAQRFRLRTLRRTRSNAGRTSNRIHLGNPL